MQTVSLDGGMAPRDQHDMDSDDDPDVKVVSVGRFTNARLTSEGA
ncbi:MAG: hypothetical protein ACPGUC_08230 [Gammaproteobacteria bacterium]